MEAHAGNIIKKRLIPFPSEKALCISLSCKLVPVLYQKYFLVWNTILVSSMEHELQNTSDEFAKMSEKLISTRLPKTDFQKVCI